MDRSHIKYVIPKWCGMVKEQHYDGMGGCWGISGGYVANKGEEYCKDCEYKKSK